MLRPGEVQHGSLLMECQSFYAMEVEYSTGYVWGGGLVASAVGLAASAASNAAAKNRAERMAQPQWRHLGSLPVVATNQRLLVMIDQQWSRFELPDLVSLHLDLGQWAMQLHFEGVPPLLMRGPWAPWLTVVISASLYGRPWPPGFIPPAVAPPRPVDGPRPPYGPPASGGPPPQPALEPPHHLPPGRELPPGPAAAPP
jgi:hypothetical protein